MFSQVRKKTKLRTTATHFDDNNDGDTRIVAFPLASSSNFFFPSSPSLSKI